jgi:hypothetical protein
MSKPSGILVGSLLLFSAVPAFADDLTGVDSMLCATNSVVECQDDGDCSTGSPSEMNVPQFIEVDLRGKRLSTTRASGLNRATEILYLQRQGEQIVLQGYENGRAFSFVIREKTGLLSAAIAAEGLTVGVFGACTPVAASR